MGLPPLARPPRASSPAVRRRMRAQRVAGTGPEVALRVECRTLGLVGRANVPVEPGDGGRAVVPDLVFDRERVAVFVHGCFFHGCPTHWRGTRANAAWWEAKILRNRARDRRQARRLRAAGWRVLTVWEHDDPARAARRVALAVREAR